MSAVVIDMLNEARVRDSIRVARTHLEAAAEQVVWQVENETWTVLGYDTWDAMREAEYGGAACMVPVEVRPALVFRLRKLGLTQKQIGDTLGVSDVTIHRDLRTSTNVDLLPTTITDSRGREMPTRYQRPRVESPKPSHERSPAVRARMERLAMNAGGITTALQLTTQVDSVTRKDADRWLDEIEPLAAELRRIIRLLKGIPE